MGNVSDLPSSQLSPRRRSTQSAWPSADASIAAVIERYGATVPLGWKGSDPTAGSDGAYLEAAMYMDAWCAADQCSIHSYVVCMCVCVCVCMTAMKITVSSLVRKCVV